MNINFEYYKVFFTIAKNKITVSLIGNGYYLFSRIIKPVERQPGKRLHMNRSQCTYQDRSDTECLPEK